jgi:hypothetical protein
VLELILSILAAIRGFLRIRGDTAPELLAFRQQLAVLKRERPRPRLNRPDRSFWTTPRQVWPCWAEILVIVELETVDGWHRDGFRVCWCWRFRPHGGRPRITAENQVLIRRIAGEYAGWGAPKIHGELQKFGS